MFLFYNIGPISIARQEKALYNEYSALFYCYYPPESGRFQMR